MKKESKKTAETELLELLKRVLPKATHDPQLAGKIYQAIELELRAKSRAGVFDQFCAKVQLPDLEPASLDAVKRQLDAAFGEGDVTFKPNRKGKTLAVELALTDGSQFSGQIKVASNGTATPEEEGEPLPPYAAFPVSLPGDPELVWVLAKRENLSPQEAGIALARIEEDFWASKTGQKLLRDRVERSFPEFISRVPAAMLGESGLKRHYKSPEPLKVLRAVKRK